MFRASLGLTEIAKSSGWEVDSGLVGLHVKGVLSVRLFTS